PMFFVQDRVGRNGRVFRMAKFRSMTVDEKRGPTWTDKNDPRVTPFGKFIRKTHLDEIPQLWNVLKGEMSLVGPRPEQPFYVEKFTAMLPYYRRRHKVRPGVTGWWQVKAKSNPESLEEIQQRLRYDFFYIENMSFKLDLEIMVRTVFVMLKGHGKA
ncbi:MAG: sugar transferase, partial [Candidatus Kapaibacterium sp.]